MANQTAPSSSSVSGNSRKLPALAIAATSTFVAILVHSYLLREHYELRFGEATGNSLCNINEVFNCAAVSASQYSELFGIPMALLGAGANAFLLLLLGWLAVAEGLKRRVAKASVLTVASGIAATSVVMGFISAVLLHHGCPFCILAYLLSFVTAGSLWAMCARSEPGKNAASASSVALERTSYSSALTPLIVIGLVTALATKIANDQIQDAYNSGDMHRLAIEKVQDWLNAPTLKINTLEPLVEGASADSARMTIVEFADFRCPHCRHAAPVMHAFISAHPDARLEFQTWPLDGECNTAISQANGSSCLLARSVYCAQKTGGNGWAAHSIVYDNQEKFMSVEAIRAFLPSVAQAAGVPSEKLIACTDSPETKTMVEKQAAVGTALQIQGTPTVFVNGRKLEAGQVMPVLNEAYRNLDRK